MLVIGGWGEGVILRLSTEDDTCHRDASGGQPRWRGQKDFVPARKDCPLPALTSTVRTEPRSALTPHRCAPPPPLPRVSCRALTVCLTAAATVSSAPPPPSPIPLSPPA